MYIKLRKPEAPMPTMEEALENYRKVNKGASEDPEDKEALPGNERPTKTVTSSSRPD